MSLDDPNLARRIGYLEGMIEAITLYAVWKDGQQRVGVMQEPLDKVLAPFRAELEEIEREAE